MGKRYEELTFTDDFMFCKVMQDESICKEVLDGERNIKMSVSMTTRAPRDGEIDKVHYHFVDHESTENGSDG